VYEWWWRQVKFGLVIADGIGMDVMMAGLGMLIEFFFVGLIVAIVMKLFQIHSTLTEIKDQLGKAPVPQAAYAPPAYVQPAAAPTALSNPQPTLRVKPSAPPATVAPMVGDVRSGEELLRELDAQMRFEESARPDQR
jgi:hypothetical protein